MNLGTFDNIYYRNTDAPVRAYQGLQFQGDYRPLLAAAGRRATGPCSSGTRQLRGRGDQPAGANPSTLGDYPEILLADRNYPEGRLDDYQRHKLRLWAIYRARAGTVRQRRRRADVALQLGAHLQPCRPRACR